MKDETAYKRGKSLNDVRAPVMMLCVLAYCGGHMSGIPHWVLLMFAAPALVGISLIFERKTLFGMMVPGWRSSIIGVVLAAVLYVVMWRAMQLATDMVVGEGTVLGMGALPRHERALRPDAATTGG